MSLAKRISTSPNSHRPRHRTNRQIRIPRMAVPEIDQSKSLAPSLRILPPLFLFFALVAQLTVRITIIERGYEGEKLRREILAADDQLRQLQLDYAYLTRPQRIAELSAKHFAFTQTLPENVRTLVVPNNQG